MIYIQILRGIASSMVVLFHCIGTTHHYVNGEESAILHLFRYGGSGVDIFFVISGFIIYYSAHATNPGAGEFLTKRLIRVVPLYWLLTLGMVGLSRVAPALFHGSQPASVSAILESLFFVSFLTEPFPIVYVGWSLEYEIFFYIAVSLLLHRSEKVWSNLIGAFAILAMLNPLHVMPELSALHTFLTNPRILEFIFGVMAAYFYKHRRLPLFPSGLVVGAVVETMIVDRTSVVALVGLPSALLVYCAARLSPATRPESRFLRFGAAIGDASYSIYLLQVFVISAACKAFSRLHQSIDGVILLGTVASIAAGYVLYVLVEQPLLNGMRRLVLRRPAPAVSM